MFRVDQESARPPVAQALLPVPALGASTQRTRTGAPAPLPPNQPPKTLTAHPPFMLRLKPIATVYFLQLTNVFNLTMLRLKRTSFESRNQKSRHQPVANRIELQPRNARFPGAAPSFFRVAFSSVNGYPRRHLDSWRCAAC